MQPLFLFHFIMKNALIVFCKAPLLLEVKTRLADSVGPKNALYFYQKLLNHTLAVSVSKNWQRVICYNKPFTNPLFIENDTFSIQKGSHLGEKMRHAFLELFQLNYTKIVIVGTDIPELSTTLIQEAFEALNSHEVVLGPTKDGGYYLLGLKKLHHELFAEEIPWSTPLVFEKTRQICQAKKLSLYELKLLSDIDDYTDLQQHKNFFK